MLRGKNYIGSPPTVIPRRRKQTVSAFSTSLLPLLYLSGPQPIPTRQADDIENLKTLLKQQTERLELQSKEIDLLKAELTQYREKADNSSIPAFRDQQSTSGAHQIATSEFPDSVDAQLLHSLRSTSAQIDVQEMEDSKVLRKHFQFTLLVF